MALFRKLFYRKPPDRLLEIGDRVYVFDCCFSSEHLKEDEFKDYMNNILVQLQSYFPDASLTVFNFRDGEGKNVVAEILSRYNISVIEYPHGYHGCPLLPLGMVYQFLRFCDNWLSSEGKQNVLLMHCEIGGWPVLSFMLACLMLYRSQYSGEERTLEMMYKQAPRELLQMFSPLNPFPSHVRYLHYITGKDNGLQWPLCDVPYSLDCLILQDAPYFDGKAGFRPIVRVYGRDPSNLVDESYRVLFTSLENKEKVHNSRQADRTQITLDVHCNIQGDVVLECILMNEHLELEEMMFRIMFNTSFVQNNVLLMNSEEIDIIWGMEDQFTKNFMAEVIFSEFDVGSNTPKVIAMEKDELEAEEFFEAEEIFSNPDLHDGTRDLDIHSTPIKVHDSILPELLSDHDDTANSSLEFDHTIHNLSGPAQVKLILDDPAALPEMVKERRQVASHDCEAQRLDNENSDMIVETHIQDSALVEDNAFITRNLRNFFQNAFNNILDDKKVICSTVSVDEAKGSLEIKLPKHNTETYDIGGQSFQDSSPEFRTPKMVDLSQYTKRIPFLADDGRSMSEINGLNLIEELECLINPDVRKAFDGGALGHATSQLEILQADQPEVSCKNEERVKVEFLVGGSVHNGNSSEFGHFNVLYRNEDAKDNHYFETEEHTILVSNGLEKALKGNKEIISRDMAQNFRTPMFCNEKRSSDNENSYHNIGTDFNTKPILDSQGQGAQSGNSEIVDWLEHQEVSHNCIKDGFVSQNNALFEFSCENQKVHVHRKKHEEQLPATSQKQCTVATSDPVTVAQKGKLLLSAGGNEKLAEPQIVIMQTSVSKDSEDKHVHLSSFPSTNNGLLPRSSPAASPSAPPPTPPPLPPPQYIHLPSSSSVSRSNRSSNHLCSLPYRESCQAPPPPAIPSFSKKQSASELLASYLPPLPPIKVNSPTKSLSTTTLTHSSFTVRKCDFELLASQLTFALPMGFQHSVKCPMTGCLYSSTLHPVKKSKESNFTSVEISTPFNASHFYVGSSPPSRRTLQASLSRNQIQGIASTPVTPLLLTVKQPQPESLNCQQVLNFPSSTPPSSNPSSPSLIVTATPLPLSSSPGAISSLMQDNLTPYCEDVPSPSHEASQTLLAASPSFSSAANEGVGACLAPSFLSSLNCRTRKAPFAALTAASPTVPRPSTPCPFLEANTAPPPPPPPPPIPPPAIGFPSTPVTEGCKGAPSLPLSLLGGHGQGSTPSSHGQISSPPSPPIPCKGPLVAPPPPPPPTAPPPPHASTPSPLLARSRRPRPLPTSGGAPPPPSPPLLEGHRVAPAPSPLSEGLGEAPPLSLPPTGYDGPPSPSQPFPFGSSEILLEPHFPGGHWGAPPPPPPPPPTPPPSEHHGGAPPPPPTPRGGVPPLPMLPGAPSAAPPPPSSGLRGPLPPLGPMPGGRGLGFARAGVPATASKKSSLKPLHWVKVTRAMQGSLWAELQKQADAQSTTEFDIAEIETLFSAVVKKPDSSKTEGRKSFTKSDKVHLIDLRRANNTEIMLTKIKMPLHDMMNAALALDESILDSDQVENLIKFCPSKEDMELLKNYTGDKESLGKCEQFFLELMKVPRVEAKLRVFCFKIQFNSQTADIRKSLYTVDSACEEIRNSNKLKEIMKTILYIGNTLNQGTARGAAVGFRLDSLLKLADTRAANNKMTLMHYLCMVLDSRSPHLMDFHEDFISLEAASKIQLKALAEEQQGVVKGLAKVEKELIASESDGVVSEVFCKTLKDFTAIAGAEVRSLTALYTAVGKNADGLALYFGEDPARCPFEQVIITLLNFVRMFRCAHEENCKEAELEKKKALKTADTDRPKNANSMKKHVKR